MKPRYEWQRWNRYANYSNIGTGDSNIFFGSIDPKLDGTPATEQPFDSPSTLMRVRGMIAHMGTGETTTSKNTFFPLSVAMFIVPAKLAAAIASTNDPEYLLPNLFLNRDGDDYPLYFSHLCDAAGDRIPPGHMVDVKAKRRVEAGSSLVMTGSAHIPTSFGTGVDIGLAWNLSILWKRS